MEGYFVVGHGEDFIVELYHLIQIDDYSDDEDDKECGGEVDVILGEEPKEDAEDEKDVEGFYDLENE